MAYSMSFILLGGLVVFIIALIVVMVFVMNRNRD